MSTGTLLLLFSSLLLFSNSFNEQWNGKTDSIKIEKLNKFSYETRLEAPQRSIKYSALALQLAVRNNNLKGAGESHRIIGIGNAYINQRDSAINHYLTSLNYFKLCRDLKGQAKVYNNIGNLYLDIDLKRSLYFYREALKIANNLNILDLIAGCHLNIGNIHFRQKRYQESERQLIKAYKLFYRLKNFIGITHSLQNLGVLSFRLGNVNKAENYLVEANELAKANKLYNSIGSINLTLTTIYINKTQFDKAEFYRDEGIRNAELTMDGKLVQDYNYTSFQLENHRKNYRTALQYLFTVYRTDSLNYNNEVSKKIGLMEEQFKYREKEHQRKLLIERQKSSERLNWAIGAVLLLSIVVIVLLITFVRKQSKTNKQLSFLNEEISRKKESLDAINKHLEDIIEERTKDLQIKNRKLSEYSSHLSHEIRGPVAAMKGLILLENDNLIDKAEFAQEMTTCVNDIDKKIIEINQTLHNPDKESFDK